MNRDELKNLILSLNQDVVFEYAGLQCCINPWNSKKFEVGYGDFVKEYNDIDTLMNDKIFSQKSLSDICSTIELN